jgi:ABC-type uncharacterized transport system auxiliary subunit
MYPIARGVRRVVAGGSLVLCSGCALLSKAQPLSPRYFSPEAPEQGAVAASAVPLELRLGQVEASAELEERIAYRTSEAELGYYETWRWTEPPQVYLRRALSRELFERRGLVRVISGVAPTLDVELVSFEEIRDGTPRGRVEVRISLRGERRVLLERSLRVERPIASGSEGDAPLRLTKALSLALGDAVVQAADLVAARLASASGAG